jgi:O-phosphoseryl-tRNA synthetase
MGKWNSKEIVKEAKADFEKTWERTKDFVISKKREKERGKIKRGSPNLIFETASKLRNEYLELGFDEIINPIFIEDADVRKQFGPEAITVLDRCYYLGGLPRPDIGISDKKINKIEKYGVAVDREGLQKLLRRYKTGDIGGDDLVFEFAKRLKIDDSRALKILEDVFSEITHLRPRASNITLRSHMTSGWFLSLESLYGVRDFPIRLFSIDRCYRREQKEDQGHLRTYHSASCVVLDSDISLEDGKYIVESILKGFGFKDFRFAPDEKRSKYYAPDTQTEVFGRSPNDEWVEIATFGLYSPVALSRYGIEDPVLNLGIGVERLAMVLSGIKDIRELAYPYFYTELTLSDEKITDGIALTKTPATKIGREIAKRIIETATEHSSKTGPCAFEVYKGPIINKKARVTLVELEDGKNLLGPAAFNIVVVYDGNIFGISKEKGQTEVLKKGLHTKITYLSAFANLAAREIEIAAEKGQKKLKVQVKGVKLPGDINLEVSASVMRYINSNNKKIDVRGPVFTTIEVDFS